MPKNRKVTKVNGATVVTKTPNKLRIGTRKTGQAASLLSTKRLQDVLEDSNLKRYHNNARTVLQHRKVIS